ncbi:MAG TPA: hypothetical protein VN253_08120 [Kofleriaceae bacterium]|nr:hypothetical protein [Kofleriaceae bacterium]
MRIAPPAPTPAPAQSEGPAPASVAQPPSDRHSVPRPVGHATSDRHSSPTAQIVPQTATSPAGARAPSQRAITQNLVSRAYLEESGSRPKTDPRLKAPGPRAWSEDDLQTRPTPVPGSEAPAPEITITHGQDPGRVARARSEGAADDAAVVQIGPPPRMTESQQFVMPARDPGAAIPTPEAGHSMVSTAVAAASPASPAPGRTAAGGRAPRPLSELATEELVRPDEGEARLEIGANGNLVIRVADRMLVRLEGVHVTGGDLAYEPATRRTRGHQTDERFDHGGGSLHVVSGKGYLIAMPGKHAFEAVALDDDILYLREDLVFAFEASLRWENGHVPGLRGKLPVVQFRGDGVLALRVARPLVRVKLPPQGLLFVDADRLAGWIGRVIPRAVVPKAGGPMGAMCVECTGEGVVLVEPAPDPAARVADARDTFVPFEPRRSGVHAMPPPPPGPRDIAPDDFLSEQDARPSIPPELADLGSDDQI